MPGSTPDTHTVPSTVRAKSGKGWAGKDITSSERMFSAGGSGAALAEDGAADGEPAVPSSVPPPGGQGTGRRAGGPAVPSSVPPPEVQPPSRTAVTASVQALPERGVRAPGRRGAG